VPWKRTDLRNGSDGSYANADGAALQEVQRKR